MPSPGQFQKCKRGVFSMSSWEPLPRPKQLQEQTSNTEVAGKKRFTAKYDYKVNPGSPLSGPEMNLTQGDSVCILGVDPDNEHWSLAEKPDGSQGYVPTNYLEAVGGGALPWLQGKVQEAPPVATLATKPYKPYVSAYTKPLDGGGSAASPDYYCGVCNKQLNGPQPYSAHMNSRAHKDEEEMANSYN